MTEPLSIDKITEIRRRLKMRREQFIIIVVFMTIAIFSIVGAKEKIVIFDFPGIGIEESTIQSIGQLFRYEYAATGKYEVVARNEMVEHFGDDIRMENKTEAVEKSKTLGADKAVVGEINALGKKIIVTGMVVDISSGGVEFSQTMSSLSLEDLETVVKRLVLSLIEKKPVSETVDVETVTEKEDLEPKRKKSFYTFGIRIGDEQPIAGFAGAKDGRIEWGLTGWYETPGFTAELAWTFNSPWETFDYNASTFSDQRVEISLFRMLSKEDISPYFGGGLGLHWVTVTEVAEDTLPYYFGETYSGSGIGANISGGLLFFRTYDFRLFLNVRYHIIFVDLDNDNINHAISLDIGLLHKMDRKDTGCLGCLGF